MASQRTSSILIALSVVVASCGASRDSAVVERIAELERQVSELQTQLASQAATTTMPPPTTVASRSVVGSLTLSGEAAGSFYVGEPCESRKSGYDDIHQGARVVAEDEEGTLIGTASLRRGVTVSVEGLDDDTGLDREDGSPLIVYACLFEFRFEGLPGDRDFYTFSAGSGNRGSITYSREEMNSNGWQVDLTLG